MNRRVTGKQLLSLNDRHKGGEGKTRSAVQHREGLLVDGSKKKRKKKRFLQKQQGEGAAWVELRGNTS